MKRHLAWPLFVLVALSILALPGKATAGEHHLGLGINFWKSVDSIAKDGFPDVEDSGVSWILSYLYDMEGPFKVELDLEYFREGFGGATEPAFAPQALVLFGGDLYGGVGIGITLSESFDNNYSSPYFLAKVGFDWTVLPRISIDTNLNWRADAFNELDNFSSSAVTLAVIARYRFKSKE